MLRYQYAGEYALLMKLARHAVGRMPSPPWDSDAFAPMTRATGLTAIITLNRRKLKSLCRAKLNATSFLPP